MQIIEISDNIDVPEMQKLVLFWKAHNIILVFRHKNRFRFKVCAHMHVEPFRFFRGEEDSLRKTIENKRKKNEENNENNRFVERCSIVTCPVFSTPSCHSIQRAHPSMKHLSNLWSVKIGRKLASSQGVMKNWVIYEGVHLWGCQ